MQTQIISAKRIEQAIDNLLVSSKGEIRSRIEEISFNIDITETQAKGYCHCLKFDGNGHLRLEDLIDFMDEKIVDYSIPRKEIDEAKAHLQSTGSTSKILRLRKKCVELFTDLEKTGEGGEILLYILAQEFLKLPQLISKMSLKTSGKLHYQGADGIHVKFDPDTDTLNLYWGESKMHKSVTSAVKNCFESLKGYLLDPFGYKSVQERDLQLITGNLSNEINDEALENMLVRYFDKDDDLSNQLVYKGICFIGFDYDQYNVLTTTALVKAEIEKELKNWHDLVRTGIKSHLDLHLKEIHVFLMPFSSVEAFRKYYLATIK
jgi:hypothetical protein